jgi:HEAT repeat protein
MLLKNVSPEINEYLVALTGKDVDAKAKAVEALVKIGAPAAGPLVEFLCQFAVWGMGKGAGEALLRIGEPAVEPLIAALHDTKGSAIRTVIRLLVQIGDQRAVEPLIGVLDAMEPSASDSAAQALESLGWQPDDVETGARYWAAMYLFSSVEGRERAAQALVSSGWQPEASTAGAVYWIVRREWGKCVEIGLPAVKPLYVMLQNPEEAIWQAAAQALVAIGEPAVEELIALVHEYYGWAYSDAYSMVLRVRAANVLGEIGDPRAVKELLDMGTKVERTSEHRQAAADALAKIGDPAVDALEEALQKDSAALQELAAWALGKIGDVGTVGDLIPLLSYSQPHHQPHVRKAAREALQAITGQDHGEDMEAWQAWWEAQT